MNEHCVIVSYKDEGAKMEGFLCHACAVRSSVIPDASMHADAIVSMRTWKKYFVRI